MIIEIQRGHVVLEVGGKRITIEGEAYFRGFGSPDFVAYKNSIHQWDPPDRGFLRPDEVEGVIETLREDFRKREMTLEIE
jgi:hypothetical protein